MWAKVYQSSGGVLLECCRRKASQLSRWRTQTNTLCRVISILTPILTHYIKGYRARKCFGPGDREREREREVVGGGGGLGIALQHEIDATISTEGRAATHPSSRQQSVRKTAETQLHKYGLEAKTSSCQIMLLTIWRVDSLSLSVCVCVCVYSIKVPISYPKTCFKLIKLRVILQYI